jgi:MFS family permease
MSQPPAAPSTLQQPSPTAPAGPALSVGQLLFCGAMVVTLAMGIRHGFGLWLQPMCMERGWSRETYSLAMAIQNLVWGAAGPLVGWWADRKGATRPLLLGAVLYPLGLLGMSMSTAPWTLMLTMGVLIGAAQSCTTYAVIYGAIGRHVPAERRSWAMGVTAAAGSFGQFLMVPLASTLIAQLGWQHALWGLAGSALLIAPLGWQLLADRPAPSQPAAPGTARTGEPTNAKEALAEALTHPSYLLLTAGYFVCGFQLAFIGVHLPSYLRDHQLPATVATTALALIGLFNIFGSYSVGTLAQGLGAVWHLWFAGAGHAGLHQPGALCAERQPVCLRHGLFVALDRATHQWHRGPDAGRALFVHAGRAGLFVAPVGLVCRRLAGGAPVRRHGQLPGGLVDRHWPEPDGCGAEPARQGNAATQGPVGLGLVNTARADHEYHFNPSHHGHVAAQMRGLADAGRRVRVVLSGPCSF